MFGPGSGSAEAAEAGARSSARSAVAPARPHANRPEVPKNRLRSIDSSFVSLALVWLQGAVSNRDRRFDDGMRIVFAQSEIFEPEIVDAFHGRIELHAGQGAEVAGQLF